jgi:glycosyltransferase involved in cell wall biosynthesis
LRLAVVASHPIQYYTPLFRNLAKRLDLTVFYGHSATQQDQAQAGFGVGFNWDIDLLSGYAYEFLHNASAAPSLDRFAGIDTPEISSRLRAGRFDAVLLLGWRFKYFHQALWAAKHMRIPVLVRGDSQLDTPRAAWKRWIKVITYPIFLRSFNGALIVGTRNREYWRHYGYPEKRMFDSPHCVDNEWFAARATPEARAELRKRLGVISEIKLVLFAGKLLPFKRPLDLIEAAALARSAGEAVEVLIAGAGPLESEMRARAKTLGVPVHFLGFCNQTEMPAVYAASDLLVLPSNGRETWGLVVNEALACGRPVLVSDAVGCAPDMAAHLGPGAFFPVGETIALAKSMQQILSTPSDRMLLAKTSAAFSIEAACSGIESAVRALSAERRPTG